MAEGTRIIGIEIDAGKAIQQIAQLDEQIEALKASEAALKKEMKSGGTVTAAQREEMARLKSEITYLNGVKRTYVSAVQNEIKANKANEGALKQLRANLANLIHQYDSLSRADREGVLGRGLKDQINEVTAELKKGEEETGRFYRNVRHYANSIKSLFGDMIPYGDKMSQVFSGALGIFGGLKGQVSQIIDNFKVAQQGTIGLAGAQKVLAVGVNGAQAAFKLLGVAIKGSIGALLILLVPLIAYFTRTQEGVEKLNVAMAKIGAVVDVILDRLAMLGKALVQVFSGDFRGAADSAKGALVGIGQELAEETKRAGELRKAMNEIEKQEAGLRARRAAEKVQIAELRREANDTTKSYAERIKAQEEANRMAIKTAEDERRIGEARIANILAVNKGTEKYKQLMDDLAKGRNINEIIANQGQAQSTIKDFNALVDAYERYNQKVQEFTQMTVEGTAKVNSIAKEAAAAAKAARDKELAEQEKVIDMQIALIRDELGRRRAEEETAHRRNIEEINRRLSEETNLTVAARRALNQQLELEQQRHNQAMDTLDREHFDQQLAKAQERHQQFLEEKKTEFNEELDALIAELAEKHAVEFEADKVDLARIMEKNEREIAIEQERVEQEAAIERLKQKLYADSKKALRVLAEENEAFAVASKALALGEIAVNTGKAIAAGTAQAMSVPFPANIAAIATTVLTVMANIATAIKTVKSAKFATGGYVSGEGSATSDSIPAMLSNTESVNNAQATAMFWPAQSAFNMMGGGAPIIPAQGDINTSAMRAGEDMLARSVSKGVQNITVVASWTEGQAVGKRLKMLESLGDVG